MLTELLQRMSNYFEKLRFLSFEMFYNVEPLEELYSSQMIFFFQL